MCVCVCGGGGGALQSPVWPFFVPPENSLESSAQPFVSTQEPVLVSLNVDGFAEVCISTLCFVL